MDTTIDLHELVETLNDLLVDLPYDSGWTHITDKKVLNKFDYELRERVVIFQEQLTAAIAHRDEIVHICNKRGMRVRLTRSKPDSWGWYIYFLHTTKGSFLFG